MQVFVDEAYTMIAAPVQCDVDGVPKGSHFARVPGPCRWPDWTERGDVYFDTLTTFAERGFSTGRDGPTVSSDR
jgi:hypothetical protein